MPRIGKGAAPFACNLNYYFLFFCGYEKCHTGGLRINSDHRGETSTAASKNLAHTGVFLTSRSQESHPQLHRAFSCVPRAASLTGCKESNLAHRAPNRHSPCKPCRVRISQVASMQVQWETEKPRRSRTAGAEKLEQLLFTKPFQGARSHGKHAHRQQHSVLQFSLF